MAENDEVRITLRLPMALRNDLNRSSDETGRSMNAEIVARLALSFDLAGSNGQLEILHQHLSQAQTERAEVIEALAAQERLLRRMVEQHRTMTILAKTLGRVFLVEGKTSIIEVLASGLRDIDVDLSADPSEEIPKRPWES